MTVGHVEELAVQPSALTARPVTGSCQAYTWHPGQGHLLEYPTLEFSMSRSNHTRTWLPAPSNATRACPIVLAGPAFTRFSSPERIARPQRSAEYAVWNDSTSCGVASWASSTSQILACRAARSHKRRLHRDHEFVKANTHETVSTPTSSSSLTQQQLSSE